MALLRCCKCGCYEHAELIDCKDDGRGDYTVEQCIACYGPGYEPLSHESLAKSVRPELKPLYAAWLAADKVREIRTQQVLAVMNAERAARIAAQRAGLELA